MPEHSYTVFGEIGKFDESHVNAVDFCAQICASFYARLINEGHFFS